MVIKVAWKWFLTFNKYEVSSSQGRRQDFGSGGGTSDKISSKVARISVGGGDIQQKFTQRRHFEKFWKIYIKFAQKFKIILQKQFSRKKLIKY